MLSRLTPRATPAATCAPRSSGPRWAMTSIMRSSVSASTTWRGGPPTWTIPQIPHTAARLCRAVAAVDKPLGGLGPFRLRWTATRPGYTLGARPRPLGPQNARLTRTPEVHGEPPAATPEHPSPVAADRADHGPLGRRRPGRDLDPLVRVGLERDGDRRPEPGRGKHLNGQGRAR